MDHMNTKTTLVCAYHTVQLRAVEKHQSVLGAEALK